MARAEAYLHAKFHLDPSNRLATMHERHGQTDRQRTDSIGRSVLQRSPKNVYEWICMKFSGKVGNGSVNKRLHFGGDPIRDPDPNTDPDSDLYRDTGKTCLSGGMHCPSASSFIVNEQYNATL